GQSRQPLPFPRPSQHCQPRVGGADPRADQEQLRLPATGRDGTACKGSAATDTPLAGTGLSRGADHLAVSVRYRTVTGHHGGLPTTLVPRGSSAGAISCLPAAQGDAGTRGG